jgi:DNA-binding LytR/AlgR family response regulator
MKIIPIILYSSTSQYFDFPTVDRPGRNNIHNTNTLSQLAQLLLKQETALVLILEPKISFDLKNLIAEISENNKNIKFAHVANEGEACEAWRMNLFHFLPIPFTKGDLIFLYSKYKEFLGLDEKEFNYSDQEGLHSIPFSKISFFKASGNYTEIRQSNNRSVLLTKQIGLIEESLTSNPYLVRVNRSWIINFKNIKSLQPDKIIFKDNLLEVGISKEMYRIVRNIMLNKL